MSRLPSSSGGGRVGRRQLLAGLGAGLVVREARAAAPRSTDAFDADADLRNLRVIDAKEDGRRFLLIVPRFQDPDRPLPLVVFLHGLGETGDERHGAYAWLERYGLGSAWQRLKRAPIARTSKRGEWTDARLTEVNAELEARPFRGFAMACPFMPKLRGAAELDGYATWLERSLVPRCRAEAGVFTGAGETHICGASLGGYVALEMVLRAPALFGGFAGVQTAISKAGAERYAERLARLDRPPALLVETSTRDPYREPGELLAAALDRRKIPNTFRLVPGPHDQPWLREAGTIEALHWLDRLPRPSPA